MVSHEYFDLFYKENANKQAKIEYSGGVMTNVELFQNSEELTETLCTENELRFGCCEASSLKFKVATIVKPLIGETITFSIVLDGHNDKPFHVGQYKVASDKEAADHRNREVVAYDAMYDILNADMAEWYNSVLPNENSVMTLKQFRESFMRHFGLTEVLPKIGEGNGNPVYGLVNDSMTVERTIDPEQISGKNIITAICEINGCFGHIGRDGKFHYIYLPKAIEGLCPANDLYPDHAPEWMAQAKTRHLYPQDPKSTKIPHGSYIPPCNYESYHTKPITKIQIRQEENDIGKIWPEAPQSDNDNCYIIQDNFLVYGKSSDELAVIAKNIFEKITDIIYRPFDCTAVGNPCLEIGDPIRLNTKYEIVESYIFSRTMRGIQALRDAYQATGVEKYSEKVNGVHRSIIQLKSKANILMRTIEETKSELIDSDNGLRSEIRQTAGEIRKEVQNTKEGLETEISQTAGEINETIKNTKEGLETKISKTVRSIAMSVSNDKTGKKAEVKLLITDEGGSKYEVTADKIDLTGLVAFTNLETSGQTIINGDNVKTGSLISLTIDNGNGTFHVSPEGNVIMQECTANGKIVGRGGYWLQYEDSSMRPPIKKQYLFAKTGYNDPSSGGQIGRPFLNIYSPEGTPCIIIGSGVYSEDKFKIRDTPFFPNGAMIRDAYIESLHTTHKEYSKLDPSIDEEGNVTSVGIEYRVRKSGAFVMLYGTYHTQHHKKGEMKHYDLNSDGDYLPTHASVRTASYEGANKGMFAFQISPSGELIITNAGDDIDRVSPANIYFTFHYTIFP